MAVDYLNLISNVGFPISAFLLMYWHNKTTITKNTEALIELKVVVAEISTLVRNSKR